MNETRRKQLNIERLKLVRDVLRENITRAISVAESQGLRPLVTCGFRSVAEQNKLYAQGRTVRGKIVTNARGGQSLHNHGKAVDIAFVSADGSIDWDVPLFRKFAAIAKPLGLKWGGDWRSIKDYPHFEID